jgi:hypothetical protein
MANVMAADLLPIQRQRGRSHDVLAAIGGESAAIGGAAKSPSRTWSTRGPAQASDRHD